MKPLRDTRFNAKALVDHLHWSCVFRPRPRDAEQMRADVRTIDACRAFTVRRYVALAEAGLPLRGVRS